MTQPLRLGLSVLAPDYLLLSFKIKRLSNFWVSGLFIVEEAFMSHKHDCKCSETDRKESRVRRTHPLATYWKHLGYFLRTSLWLADYHFETSCRGSGSRKHMLLIFCSSVMPSKWKLTKAGEWNLTFSFHEIFVIDDVRLNCALKNIHLWLLQIKTFSY